MQSSRFIPLCGLGRLEACATGVSSSRSEYTPEAPHASGAHSTATYSGESAMPPPLPIVGTHPYPPPPLGPRASVYELSATPSPSACTAAPVHCLLVCFSSNHGARPPHDARRSSSMPSSGVSALPLPLPPSALHPPLSRPAHETYTGDSQPQSCNPTVLPSG